MWGTEMGNASLIREQATWCRTRAAKPTNIFPAYSQHPGAVLSWLADAPAHAVPRDDWTGGRLERDRDVPEDPK